MKDWGSEALKKATLFIPAFLHSPVCLAFICGICATLTLPPFHLFPLAIPAYGGLFVLLNRAATRRRAVTLGFFWGWGFCISGLYWFCIALLTDPEKFAWLIPFALFGLTAVIALYSAVFAWLYYGVRRRDVGGALIFAALWLAVEYARGHLFTGFPWNLAGYVFNASEASLQLASVVGIYGLTFIAVLVSLLCVVGRLPRAVALLTLLVAVGWGQVRVAAAPYDWVDGVMLRLVQANIQQHHKWDPALQMAGLQEHVLLSQSEGMEHVTHIIWPETAMPFVLREASTMSVRLAQILQPGQYLITGSLRAQTAARDSPLYNSMVMLDDAGHITGYYDKHKLVPFGEFLPLRRFIPAGWSTPVGDRDFSAGPGKNTLSWPGLPPVAPLICYEVIFPQLAAEATPRPAWLLSLTNDAWFGHSTGPYQHLAMARMRAVEQGVPMVRAANTGISAIYDGYGREIARINLGQKAVFDSKLPKSNQSDTIYARLSGRSFLD